MSKQYNTVVFLLRGQPVHNAHAAILQRAGALASKVIIIVGSSNQPRTFKNPFTFSERAHMLKSITGNMNAQVFIESNTDTIYNDPAWVGRVQAIVGKHTAPGDKIALIGHKKDASTFYLDMFPQWDFVEQPLIEPLHATSIRDLYFRRDMNLKYLSAVIPEAVLKFLESFADSPEYEQIIREREHVEQYKKQYASLPYAPVFVTADAVVICSGHILMIKRRSEPGKGLWALPGGFLNANTDRSMKDAMIRELREETGIKVPVPVLNGSITKSQVFDAIDRSARGRTITHAFRIDLPAGELPKVKGLDDAEKAKWVPISEIDSSVTFEDHYEIIQTMLGA
jgi:bifunctional NMN adenylyltransferase/nudix hydrolase